MDPAPAAAIVAAVASLCAAPMTSRLVGQARLARECARRRTLVLTYDDGPGERVTPRVLDLLRAHGARASFFALGSRAQAHPELLDRVLREGHEVGSHSFDHLPPWRSMPWSSARDTARGMRALAPWDRGRRLFRPPQGKLTPATWAIAAHAGARFAWWTLDSRDRWDEFPSADVVLRSMLDAGGGVVLLHDADHAEADRVEHTCAVTERLLVAARASAISVVPLGELLDGLDRAPNGRIREVGRDRGGFFEGAQVREAAPAAGERTGSP